MRKILVSILLIFLTMPAILSFAGNYYLQNKLINNFSTNVEIEKLDFNHGWFSSNASLNLRLKQQNLLIKTDNQIDHGPIIWRQFLQNPIQSFALYKINTRFNLENSYSTSKLDSQSGSAATRVNYFGTSHPQIQHPGLNLTFLQTNVFADLMDIEAQIDSDGYIDAVIKTNQLELNDGIENFYLVNPEFKLGFNSELPFPESIDFSAINLSGQLAANSYQSSAIELTGRIIEENNTYHFQSILVSDALDINEATISRLNVDLLIKNLDHELIEFINNNYDSISSSIQNNQWLVLLKHFSDLLKLIDHNQPEFHFTLVGQTDDKPIKIDFFANLLAQSDAELNPFSFLENLNIQLETSVPTALVKKLNQLQFVEFLKAMQEKGLLIEKQQSYYASVGFKDTKLNIKH